MNIIIIIVVMFVNRKEETDKLLEISNLKKTGLAIVYERCRVGK